MHRKVFFISDSTGITAETLGNALLAQFDGVDYDKVTLPFVSDAGLAEAAVRTINAAGGAGNGRPVIFTTITNRELYEIVCRSDALVLDLFEAFLPRLEEEFQLGSTHATGRYHGLINRDNYEGRIEAIDFALSHDDGASVQQYDLADLILNPLGSETKPFHFRGSTIRADYISRQTVSAVMTDQFMLKFMVSQA